MTTLEGFSTMAGQDQDANGGMPIDAAPARVYVAKLHRNYKHGANLFAPCRFKRHQRARDEPRFRPLRVFMMDPVQSGYAGRIGTIEVPYEKTEPGPVGSFLEIFGPERGEDGKAPALDLDHPGVLIAQGRRPAASDGLFRRQMAYAVCCDVVNTFSKALGRDPSWGFPVGTDEFDRLKVRTEHAEYRNAGYDKQSGELRFGYFNAEAKAGAGVLPGGRIYTCLSHDIIAHEMTHALLDGMRSRFDEPTNPDVLAFHEGFADLVAVLTHFTYEDVVRDSIAATGGELRGDESIYALAEEFGQATGANGPLRIALSRHASQQVATLDETCTEPHQRGAFLVGAILDAMSRVFERRAAPVKELHDLIANGRGRMHAACIDQLALLAAKIARQFLALCIRAIDYCPPIDLTFGEYLRALITADHDLVEYDRYKFREELIAAFGHRRMFPSDVTDISEEALLWCAPNLGDLPVISGLGLAALQLSPDPAQAAGPFEIERQAAALADVVTKPEYLAEFGLTDHTDFGCPSIESVRVLRRVGADREVLFGMVCEVLQTARSDAAPENAAVVRGATIILDGSGKIIYAIRKRAKTVASDDENIRYVCIWEKMHVYRENY